MEQNEFKINWRFEEIMRVNPKKTVVSEFMPECEKFNYFPVPRAMPGPASLSFRSTDFPVRPCYQPIAARRPPRDFYSGPGWS